MMAPKTQATVAEGFGEAPVNLKACELTKNPDHCTEFHADDDVLVGRRLLLGHADRGLRRRGRHLRDAGGLAQRLDGDPRLGSQTTGAAPPPGSPGRRPCQPSRRTTRAGRASRARPAALDVLPPAPARERSRALLAAPLGWLLIGYLGSLFVLLLAAFWDTNSFTAEIVHSFTLDNFRQILEDARLPRCGLAHDQDGGARDDRLRGARVPDRVLHGAGGVARGRATSSSSPCSCRCGRATS